MNTAEFKHKVKFLTDQINECKAKIQFYRTTDEPYSEVFRSRKIRDLRQKITWITQDLIDTRKHYNEA